MRTRLLLILFTTLLVSLLLAGSPRATQVRPTSPLLCLSPPMDLELTAGQAIEISCRLTAVATASRVEFYLDDHPLHSEAVEPGRAITTTWLTEQTGRHTLTIVAWLAGRQVATERRQILVVPRGAPVRVP